MRKLYLCTVSAAAVLSVSACGGDRVASAPPPPPAPKDIPPPSAALPPPDSGTGDPANSAEYARSNAARNVNVLPAWDKGATGAGVKIGFVDSGLNPNNPEFAGRIDSSSQDVAGSRSMSDTYGHGTAVVSLAAAARNDVDIVGTAPKATIVMMKADEPGCSQSGCSFSGAAIEKGIRLATSAGAKVINLSMGGDAPSSGTLDAVKRAAAAGVVFIVAAGNDSGTESSGFAREVAAAAAGQAVIVGALGTSSSNYDDLATLSNRAGSFQDWFVSAPGYLVSFESHKGGLDGGTGTSFAAPVVAGAAALLKQAFPTLSAKDIVQILLTTADDLGTTGVDAVYGHGRLNIGRAFEPVGATSLAGTEVPMSLAYNGSAPAASGDAVLRGSLGSVVLDSYARAFAVDLAGTLAVSPSERPLARAIDAGIRNTGLVAGPLSISMNFASQTYPTTPWSRVATGAPGKTETTRLVSVSAFTQVSKRGSIAFSKSAGSSELEAKLANEGSLPRMINDQPTQVGIAPSRRHSIAARQSWRATALGFSAERGELVKNRLDDRSPKYGLATLSLQHQTRRAILRAKISELREEHTVLGGTFSAVFGNGKSRTTFAEVRTTFGIRNGWSAYIETRRGWTQFAAGAFRSSAHAVAVLKKGVWAGDDSLLFKVSQPLRIEAGGLSLELPISYDYDSTTAIVGHSRFSLSPSGRERILEAAYERPLVSGVWGLNAFLRHNPGHAEHASADIGAAFHLSTRW